MTCMHFAHDRSSQPSLNVRRKPQTFNLHSKRIHSIRRFREFHRIYCTVRHASSFLFNHFALASCVHFLSGCVRFLLASAGHKTRICQ